MAEITEDDIRRINNICYAVMRAYPHVSITKDDLFQEGVIGFLEAKSRYDKTKNDYFWGYAFRRVKGSMLDYVRKCFRRISHEQPATTNNFVEYTEGKSELDSDYYIQSETLIEEYFLRMKKLTPFEQQIIYQYFINKVPIYKLAQTYHTKRRKVSLILYNTLEYLKGSFE